MAYEIVVATERQSALIQPGFAYDAVSVSRSAIAARSISVTCLAGGPTAMIEPLKFVAVAIAGEGHWIRGTAMIVVAYAGSLFVVDRLFRIVKPKLMTLSWFAKVWAKVLIARVKVIGLFQRT